MFSRENCLSPWLGGRSIEVGRLWNWICHHKATSVAAYMFAICWFISFVFIYNIFRVLSQKGPHVSLEPKIIKAFEEKMTNLNKEITTRSKTLEEACSKYSCFLGCLGHHNKSHQQCVFVVLSKANHSILVQEKSLWDWDNRLSMYGNIGMSLVGSKEVMLYFFKRHWRYILLDNVCVYLTLSCIQVTCALLSLVPLWEPTCTSDTSELFFSERGFGKNTQCMEVSSKTKLHYHPIFRNSHEKSPHHLSFPRDPGSPSENGNGT